MNKSEQLIACLEGEIAKRDETIARLEPQLNRAIQANYDLREELAACRVAVENCEVFRARIAELEFELEVAKKDELSAAVWAATETIKHDLWDAQAELAALKAQEPAGWTVRGPDGRLYLSDYATEDQDEADLWPSTLIEGFTVVRVYALPVSEAKAQGVVMPERAIKDGGKFSTELKVTGWNACLDEVARLNATHAQHPKCKTCDDNGMIGGPSFYAPDDGGEPCPDCSAPVQQVSVPDERAAFEREDRYIVIKRSDMDRIPNQKVVHSFLGALGELSAHSVRIPQRKFLVIESDWPEYDPAWKLIQDRVQGRPILDAAPAAPAADAGLVEALDYQALFDAIAAATSVYANGAINISVQAFRDALSAHRAKGVV